MCSSDLNDDAHYKPGMFVWVDLPQGQLRDVLAVPAAAVMRHEGKAFVFVPDGEGRFRRRDIETGIETDTLVEVTRGLAEGEEVVSRGAFLLKSRLLLEKEAESASVPRPSWPAERWHAPAQSKPPCASRGIMRSACHAARSQPPACIHSPFASNPTPVEIGRAHV